MSRASGFIGPEPFGNISALLSGLALLGVIWFWVEGERRALIMFNILGTTAGVGALILSSTRASWLAFIAVFIFILLVIRVFVPDKRVLRFSVFFLVLGLVFSSLSDNALRDRAIETYKDLQGYFHGESELRSVGLRLEVWQSSLKIFSQSPLVGSGSEGYDYRMEQLASGSTSRGDLLAPGHAHNEIIDALAKKGAVGGLLVLLVYFVPGVIFFRRYLATTDPEIRIFAAAGVVIVMNFFIYGMAHANLENNAGMMNYAFWVAIFLGLQRESDDAG